MTAGATEVRPVRPTVWPTLVGLVLFPLLQFGLPVYSGNFGLALVGTLAAYLLTIWLFRAVTVAVRSGYQTRVLIVGFVAGAVAVMVSPLSQVYMALVNTVMIPLAGVAVARTLMNRAGSFRAYLYGAAVVAVAGVAIFGPQWEMLMFGFQAYGDESVALIKQTMATMGYHAEAAEEYAVQFQQLWNATIRIIPAMTVMSLVTQFTVGFLWFLMRPGSTSDDPIKMEPFTRWKVPFGLTPVLIVAVIGRLTGGEMVGLVADNVLLALSIYYCVGGLAWLEHTLKRIKIPMFVKIVFYIMLTLAGVIGYVAASLVGFIDSFADWRKINGPPIELKTE